MISSGEIQRLAKDQGVRDTQIEKDYVIGWVLKGISAHPYLAERLIFKGGTVLKKVWFEEYRFSEDLDFTVNADHWHAGQLEAGLSELCEWVYEESRIRLTAYPESGTTAQYKCYFRYQGPLGGEKTIKCDISSDEKIYFPPVHKAILNAYSDADRSYQLRVYALEEALAEKLRCLLQRTIPRDVYDVWYLTEQAGIQIEAVGSAFQAKSEYKGLDHMSILRTLEAKEKKYRLSWTTSLRHQIGDLPEFEEVWRGLTRNVKKLVTSLSG